MAHSDESEIYWCATCNIPILKEDICPLCGCPGEPAYLGKGEIRPIFDLEKKWYKELLTSDGHDPEKYLPSGLCLYYNGSVIVDGKKIFRVTFDEKDSRWKIKFYKKYLNNEVNLTGSNLQTILEANSSTLEALENESLTFIQKVFNDYPEIPRAVSFSGGKDSVATLHLVRQLSPDIDTIYMNTTIDFPETVDYIHNLAQLWDLNLIEVRPEKDFFTMCDELGPPSKFMKWCCKTTKFGPINRLIDSRYEDKVIVASGVRKNESNSRSKYYPIQVNKTIPKQILYFPILNWNSIDVWLYLFSKKIPINEVYLKGYSRIGCWLCPEKTLREFKKMERTHPKLVNDFYNYLKKFAAQNNVENAYDWINSGKWRYRVSRYNKSFINRESLCSIRQQYLYDIKDISRLSNIIEFMKVFGPIKKEGKLIKVTNHNLELSIIGNYIRVNYYSNNSKIIDEFEKQLEKAVNCMGCGACISNCEFGALSLKNGYIKISDNCKHCQKCIKNRGLRKSCISLNYKEKQQVINII
jgi:phosphoadenosine phosphosulfate reductase